MPGQTTKSKLDFKRVAKAASEKPIDYGREFIDLPGGITGGVARLASMKLSVYKSGPNQGKQFFHAMGTVEQPKTATKMVKIWNPKLKGGKGGVEVVSTTEVEVEGQFTSIMIPLCDTKRKDKDGNEGITSAEEHADEMMMELRKLGGEDCVAGVESEADLEAVFTTLVEAKPAFKFSTQDKEPTKDYPNGGTWGHKWFGTKGMDNYQSDESSPVEDSTPSANGKHEEPVKDKAPDAPDLDALAAAADKKGPKSKEAAELEKLAEDAGIDSQAVADATNWAEVVALIQGAGDSAPADDEGAADEAFVPVKEGIYIYYPVDPKTKKQAKKGIEAEVIAIDRKKELVDLKSLDDKKVYKAVPWSELTQE